MAKIIGSSWDWTGRSSSALDSSGLSPAEFKEESTLEDIWRLGITGAVKIETWSDIRAEVQTR